MKDKDKQVDGDEDLSAVPAAVLAFRRALERAHLAGDFSEHPALRSFPRGCCGKVSVFLGAYLRDHGLGCWSSVTAWRTSPSGGSVSHAWLTRGTVIIDVTADQFAGENRGPVWVDDADDWYRSWEISNRWSNPVVSETGPDRDAYRATLLRQEVASPS